MTDEPRCTATSTTTGKRCRHRPIRGGTVCATHGGSAPQVRAAAAHRLDLEAARQAAELWGGRKDIHPAQALLELVQQKAREVEYWRWRVAQVDSEGLLWGTTKVKTGGDDRGTTEEAKPHAALVQLRQCERDLADYSAMAMRAGCDAALVQLAQDRVDALFRILQTALTDSRVTIAGDPGAVIHDAMKALAA